MLGCRVNPTGERTLASDQCGAFSTATVRTAMLSAIIVLLAACSGGSGGDDTPVRIQSVAITPADPSRMAGTTVQLLVTATYTNGATENVTSSSVWSSDAPSVAAVSETGLVSTGSVGTTEIKVIVAGRSARTTFAVTSAYTETILYTFGLPPDGTRPSSLIHGADGNFYGTATSGGPNECNGNQNSCGILFKITPQGEKTTLYEFDGGLEGFRAQGPLLQASDGNFYGTTTSGGVTGGGGTIFKITPDGSLTTLHSFGITTSDGYNPSGGLVEGSDGSFYGVTHEGGAHYCSFVLTTCGTVYKITPGGSYTTLYSFGATPEDGYGPAGELIEAGDGNFYGTTDSGGANSCSGYPTPNPNTCGTVFMITPAGDATVVHSFGATPFDGIAPGGTLIQTSDGNIYGTTIAGGENFDGTFFMIAPDGTESVLYSFGISRSDGKGPAGPLTVGNDGNFYGITLSGGYRDGAAGIEGNGTVFMITPDGVETTLYAFGNDEGYSPEGAIVPTSDGSLYGVTIYSSPTGYGTVYRLRP